MRIAMCNWTARRVGGAETYLARVIPALRAGGHQVVLAAQQREGTRRAIDADAIPADPDAIAAWRPDVILNHGLLDPESEMALFRIAPTVLFAQSYYGTCLSGQKTLTFPSITPCTHTLGWGCLLRYYPRRTGGLSPVTLSRLWRVQRRRQSLLPEYRKVLVFSRHMLAEYQAHGCDRVEVLPFPVEPAAVADARSAHQRRLLFVGRCDVLKGGRHLVDAMGRLGDGTTLTVVGDGPARAAWEQAAQALGRRVAFLGWLEDVETAYRDADLLVVPSLWPEPFGQVGLEAARYGLPSVAYATGGIPEWLKHGVNGLLARRHADPDSLAEAIHAALDPGTYAPLSAGALRALGSHRMDTHVSALVGALDGVT